MKQKNKSLYCVLYGKIGDSIHYARALDAFHTHSPTVPITVMARENIATLSELFAAYPFIRVIPYTWKTILTESLRSRANTTQPIILLQFLFGVMPWNTYTPAYVFARISGGSIAGFVYKTLGRLRHVDIKIPFDPKLLYIENLAQIFIHFNITPITKFPFFQFKAKKDAPAGTNKTIVLFPFAAREHHTLPEGRWVSLFSDLASRLPEHRFVIVGGPDNSVSAKKLAQAFPSSQVQTFTDLPLSSVAQLIKTSGIFVGVDSGITHLAASIETSTKLIEIGNLENPTSLPKYNPRVQILIHPEHCICTGDSRVICSIMYQGHSYLRCMFEVSDQEIIDAIVKASQE